jgi:hypothetical protein
VKQQEQVARAKERQSVRKEVKVRELLMDAEYKPSIWQKILGRS